MKIQNIKICGPQLNQFFRVIHSIKYIRKEEKSQVSDVSFYLN